MSSDEFTTMNENLVGPVVRSGELADAVIDAAIEDNPDREVMVFEREDYVRIHAERNCVVTRASIEKHLGRAFNMAMLEIEMPSFKGRMQSSTEQMRWFYVN
ncbi:MAG: MmoB/DmpM family protein [Rhodospirillales bacterium]|nr:MmoB/DmpM family protein [Rhodospirillales bacterium]